MASNSFVPKFRYIIGITNSQYAIVEFSEVHDFVLNEIVSFRVTKPFGMFEVNDKRAKVLSLDDFHITVDIDTTLFNPFIYPVETSNAPPVCVPVGSGVNLSTYSPYTILEDAFDNIRV